MAGLMKGWIGMMIIVGCYIIMDYLKITWIGLVIWALATVFAIYRLQYWSKRYDLYAIDNEFTWSVITVGTSVGTLWWLVKSLDSVG